MRGKDLDAVAESNFLRITPAYAGKRPWVTGLDLLLKGSPPPMRGKVSGLIPNRQSNRITPAYAGKSYL